MGDPFRIILDFDEPIRSTPGSIMVMGIKVEGLPDDADKNYHIINGLAYVLTAHVKSIGEGSREDVTEGFAAFISSVWEHGPIPLPAGLTGAGVADA